MSIKFNIGPSFCWPTTITLDAPGLRPYKPQDKIHELGYHLRRQYWGMGLAEEAGRAVVNFAFENLGAKALFAGHHPQNLTSRRVLEKLGFRFTHEELYPPTGLMNPSYLLTRPLNAIHPDA